MPACCRGLPTRVTKFPPLVLEWRQLAKLKSTYADALVNEVDATTGRVHTTFAMAATTTGRLSSIDPNLQNIPIRTEEGGRIRRAFVAAEGNVLVSADYSQIELRLLAHVAQMEVLRESFARGEDIHARTASEVFGVPMEKMDGWVTRRRAKAINFGIIYGISAFGLARQLSIGAAEARDYIDRYFQRYPGIRAYMDVTRAHARRHWLCGDTVRAPLPCAGNYRPQPGAPGLCRTPGDQCAVAGRGCGCDQAGHGAVCRRPWRRRACGRACCCRCMTNCCSRRQKKKRRRSR